MVEYHVFQLTIPKRPSILALAKCLVTAPICTPTTSKGHFRALVFVRRVPAPARKPCWQVFQPPPPLVKVFAEMSLLPTAPSTEKIHHVIFDSLPYSNFIQKFYFSSKKWVLLKCRSSPADLVLTANDCPSSPHLLQPQPAFWEFVPN